jgi:hypothetical protein
MRKALIPAFLLVLGAIVLGATVFPEQLARAAKPIDQVFVTNTSTDPVPVAGTVGVDPAKNTVNLGSTDSGHLANIDAATGKLAFDSGGNLKTVSASSEPAVATKFEDDFVAGNDGDRPSTSFATIDATSIVIHAFGHVNGIFFSSNGTNVLTLFGGSFSGPGDINGGADVVVPLTTAIPIDKVTAACDLGTCEVWFSIAGF